MRIKNPCVFMRLIDDLNASGSRIKDISASRMGRNKQLIKILS